MKLPAYSGNLQADLTEFDIWITPSLGEIRDTQGFKEELQHLVKGFEAIRQVTNNFADEASCRPQEIGVALQKVFGQLPTEQAIESLSRITSVLYLVTGKSDNNAKCQFPLFLRDQIGIVEIPTSKAGKIS